MRRNLILSGLLSAFLVNGAGSAAIRAADDLIDARALDALSADLDRRDRSEAKSLEELLARAREIRKSVMFVGRAEGKDVRFGTAFIISREHRLLATNAHIADLMKGPGSLRAILNDTGHSYEVDRRWYHPGVRRRTRDGSAIVRSQNPDDGAVALPCPDVAVLRLADGGPDLPGEAPLATRKELEDLVAQPVGVVGFPAYNYTRWPGPRNKVVATVQEGIINRLSDYSLEADGPPERLQLVQHSVETWFGFSGAPVFLANGHVAAIIAGARPPIHEQGLVIRIPMAIRIDGLWELLAHHELADLLKLPAGQARPPTPLPAAADPREEQLRRAVQLVQDAEQLAWRKEHRAAIERCDAALKLAPNYAPAYKWGALSRWYLCSDSPGTMGVEEQTRLMKEGIAYLRKSLALTRNLDDLIDLVGMNNYSSGLTGNREGYEDSLDILKRILAMPGLTRQQRGRALQSRAAVRWALGDHAVLDDYNEAIKNLPDDPFLYEDRATYYERTHQPDHAAQDRRKAQSLRAQDPLAPSR